MAAKDSWQGQLSALGELIRSQRRLANLSLRELAERTNVSNPYLSQIERGMHEPSVRVLRSIARALNVSAETLLSQAGLLERDDTAALLAVNGARVEVAGDDLIVHGGGTLAGGGVVETVMDHRIAMAALVLGVATEQPVTVDESACIDTSFPGFAGLMNRVGGALAPA